MRQYRRDRADLQLTMTQLEFLASLSTWPTQRSRSIGGAIAKLASERLAKFREQTPDERHPADPVQCPAVDPDTGKRCRWQSVSGTHPDKMHRTPDGRQFRNPG